MAVLLLLQLFLVTETQAQCATAGFNPNPDGAIRAIVLQPDGKILIGGGFTTLSPNGGVPVTRRGIARLNADGSLDMDFDCGADCITSGTVSAIALQADGKVLVAGQFNTVGGQTRNNIARLDGTTGLVDSFNPNADSFVESIAVQADGKVLVGGDFANVGGQPRSHMARLDGVTGLPDSFDASADGIVRTIALQADGKILAGGNFVSIGGQTRSRIARLDAVTGLADSFDPHAAGTSSVVVLAIAVQGDGKILAGGNFSSIGGQQRRRIGRLDPTTGLADSFDPNVSSATSFVWSLAVQANGKVLAGGMFFTVGGLTRNYIARLDATSGLVDSFDPNGNGTVFSLAVQPDGNILAGGNFTNIGGQTRNFIAQLSPDCPPPTTLGNISTRLRVETGDNVLIGGFIVTGPQPKRVIVRAIGPSLPVAGALADPVLELRDHFGLLIQSNDNWRSDQEAEIEATTIPPSNDLEAAIVATLPAEHSAYTAIVRGVNGGTGVALIEAYDLDRTVNSQLANISTRGLVQTEDNVLIAGTIVLGQAPQRVLVRAIGPSLPVPGKLEDPTLELRDGNGTLIRSNDNWRTDQEAEIMATTIPPSNDLESALIETLPANGAAYTAIVRGVNNSTGVALVEVYALN